MIPKSRRFRGRKSIAEVHRRGTGARTKLFGLKVLPRQKSTSFRLAVVVSKKVSKSAVVRNRIRRRIFACFRQDKLAGLAPFDIVITIYDAELANTPQTDLVGQLSKALASAGVISNS